MLKIIFLLKPDGLPIDQAAEDLLRDAFTALQRGLHRPLRIAQVYGFTSKEYPVVDPLLQYCFGFSGWQLFKTIAAFAERMLLPALNVRLC